MWWLNLVLAQAAQNPAPVSDPAQQLINSGNPTLMLAGTVLALLFGADKVAFWYNRLKPKFSNGSGNGSHHDRIESRVATALEGIREELKALPEIREHLAILRDRSDRKD